MTGQRPRGRAGRRPTKYELRLEAEARELARNLAELLAHLRHARDNGAEWYVWVASGRPPLTEAEYALVGKHARGRVRSSSSPAERPELDDRTAADDWQGTLA